MTAIRYIARACTRPVLSWADATVFAFLVLVSWQYHWPLWLQLLVSFAFGLVISVEHDWLRLRASRKERTP